MDKEEFQRLILSRSNLKEKLKEVFKKVYLTDSYGETFDTWEEYFLLGDLFPPLEIKETRMTTHTSAIFCNHANESGINCDCRGDCYCRQPGGMCEFRLKPGVMIIENPEAQALNVDTFLAKIKEEYMRAARKFKPFNSKHEGYAVLLEEIDELWEAVKTDKGWTKLEEEGIQVAAMALRFLMDVVNAKRTLRRDGSGA